MPTPYAYFQGDIVPLSEAKIGIMTHAFNYGTAVFEGIRGNWNEEAQTTYLFRTREHMQRLGQSSHILGMQMREPVEKLCEDRRRARGAERVHRGRLPPADGVPLGEVLGVRLHNVDVDTLIFLSPFPAYLPETARCHTSTWRRVQDTGIPPRAKVTGIYVNSALAKTEANANGFDEAIMLNENGHVSEGSGENIFMIRHGQLITPGPADNVLEGITAKSVMQMAADDLGIPIVQREIDRTELYIADEVFMTGTAAHLTPIVEIDRRKVGEGRPGPITSQLSELFYDAIRGRSEKYRAWCTPARARIAR
ncbi:MAG: branched-chain amino acid transaminase [Dehalococcoidia bacterium]|nr:branched-chain amino acid transaminase [Dehalococcoidia bacterium]